MIKYRWHVLFGVIALSPINFYVRSWWLTGVEVALSLLSIACTIRWARNHSKGAAVFAQMAGPSKVPPCRLCGRHHDFLDSDLVGGIVYEL